MSGETNKLISQEGKKDYGEEATEETKALSQGNDKFYGADDTSEEACAEENAFDRAHAEESAARACSQKAMNMARYATETANNTKEEEEEENSDGNSKQPETNPIGGSCSWGKKKSWRGHDRKGQGTWPGMQQV